MRILTIILMLTLSSCSIHKHTTQDDPGWDPSDEINFRLRLHGKWLGQYRAHEITADQYIKLLQDEVNRLIRK